jgi:hypothetical protein
MTSAVREAAPRSPDVAADLLERAVELMEPTDPGRDLLLAERASSLIWAGRVADSEQACRSLLDRDHDPAADGPVRTCLGLVLPARGRPADGLAELEQAWRSPMLTNSDRATGLGWASIIRMWLGDLDGATMTAAQAREAAAEVGDAMAATAMFAVVAMLRGNLPDADSISAEAVRLADASPGREGHRYPVSAPRAFILIELDRLGDAVATLSAGARVSEDLGIPWHSASYQMVRAVERFLVGEWDDAAADVEARAPDRLRLARIRSGISACLLRDSTTTKLTNITAAAASDATTFRSPQCETPAGSVLAWDRP